MNASSQTSLEPVQIPLGTKDNKTSYVRRVLSWWATPLTASAFLLRCMFVTVFVLALIALLNIYIDVYGLFRAVNGREIPVYHNERISKYLLAYKYIPANFNTIVLGTSLSANLDVRLVNEASTTYRVYNASIMGANMSELKPLAEKCIEGGIRHVIICFSPYMTRTSGSKEVDLNGKLFYSALGSKQLLETYGVGVIRHFNLLPGKYPKDQINELGVNRYESLFRVQDVQQQIDKVIMNNKSESLSQDSIAMAEMKELISLFKKMGVRVTGYFHPVPAQVFKSRQDEYELFQQAIQSLLDSDHVLVNFNSPEFNWITTDLGNYIDHGHLSNQGQQFVMNHLLQVMNDHQRPENLQTFMGPGLSH